MTERYRGFGKTQFPVQDDLRVFWSFLECLDDGVIVVGENGYPAAANAAARRILQAEVLDAPIERWPEIYGIYLPDKITPFPHESLPVTGVLRGEEAGSTEVFLRSSPQSPGICAIFKARPVSWGDNKCSVVTISDITEEKKAVEALRRQRDLNSTVLETIGALVIVLDREGRIVKFNRACEETTGFTSAEVLGKRFWDILLAPDEIEHVKTAFYSICAGEFPVRFENDWVTSEGQRRNIAWSNSALLDAAGAVELVVSTGIDITERRQAEQEFRNANSTLRALLESSPLAIWAHDLKGNVKFWNASAERIFGWREQEVLHRPLPIIPDDQRGDFEQLLARYRAGEVLRGVERRRRKKDGSPIDISIWTAPLRDGEGNINAVLGIILDITERKQLEEQFRQAQKMEAVGRLAGGIAHDFNNLLMIISGYGQMLRDTIKPDDFMAESVAEILKAAESAAALTNRLLTFSRRQVSQPRVLNLNSVVQGMDKLLHRMIGEDIDLVTELAQNLSKVKVDPVQIEQVLMNLVVNSRDAMPGGGRLTIRTANVFFDEEEAQLRLDIRSGPYVMLSVEDTGTGIKPEIMPHLFEPFYTTKEKGKGTGLGLSIVYGIIKQNNGEIWVESTLGVGTTFKICLPVVEGTTPKPPVPKLRRWPKGTETVLLAEDQSSLRQLISGLLRRHGYTVLEATDVTEAIRLSDQHNGPIHLLLTDVVMPRMSGRELAQHLLNLRPGLKIIYMSGYADSELVQDQIAEEGSVFLQKPFTPETLVHQIRQVLDSR